MGWVTAEKVFCLLSCYVVGGRRGPRRKSELQTHCLPIMVIAYCTSFGKHIQHLLNVPCTVPSRRAKTKYNITTVYRARGGRECIKVRVFVIHFIIRLLYPPFHSTIYFLSLWPRGMVFAMSACPAFPPEYSQSILTPSIPQTSSVLLGQTPRRLRPHSQLVQLYPAPLRSCRRPLNRRRNSSTRCPRRSG